MPTDRPHGHPGANSAKLAADRAIMREHFGPFYRFVQRLGGMPILYFVIAVIVDSRSHEWSSALLYGVVAAFYAFLFHIMAISYLAMRSKIGLDTCPKKSFGYFWSKIFIGRASFFHIAIISCIIWLGPYWFLGSGIILYIIDYIIIISTTIKWSLTVPRQ